MFLAAAAVVVLSGCVKSEDVDLGGKKTIGFKAFNEVAARGPIEGTAYPTDGKFKVFSVLDNGSTEYFEPTVFAKRGDANEWSGETPRYWPSTGVLDFAAYHPATLTGSATYSGGIASITIANINNKADQNDIMFSNLVDDAPCTAHATQPMVFNHALSWIEVHVAAEKANLFEVTSLKLNNTVQGGTLTITPAATSTAVWSAAPTTGVDMPIVADATAVPTTAAKIGKSVLVVPGAQTSIDLTYTLNGVQITHPTITLDGTWEMGKKYIYTISFGANEIKFTPSVVDSWKTPESITGGTI